MEFAVIKGEKSISIMAVFMAGRHGAGVATENSHPSAQIRSRGTLGMVQLF